MYELYTKNDSGTKPSNVQWTLDKDIIVSNAIHGTVTKNNIAYKNSIMYITFENNTFTFKIYDNNTIPALSSAAYRIDNGTINYEKGIVAENNVLKIEEEILAPFFLNNEPFKITFFDASSEKAENYTFELPANNFVDVWPYVNGKKYEHLPVWETAR